MILHNKAIIHPLGGIARRTHKLINNNHTKATGYESDKEENRPDICIGVDEFHTPKDLVNLLKANLEEVGYGVKINSPFSGSIVPLNFYK